MPGKREVDAALRRLGFSMKEMQSLFAAGGDPAERKFMECCWCLWKAKGVELVESFVEATFNKLPEKSRSVLFQRMLTIVYVAQDSQIKSAPESNRQQEHAADAPRQGRRVDPGIRGEAIRSDVRRSHFARAIRD